MENLYEIFSQFCKRLEDTINHECPIRERELYDFSMMVGWIISDKVRKLPESYSNLQFRVSEYWRYEVNTDASNSRRNSYIRLFQMTNVIQMFIAEAERLDRVMAKIDKYDKYYPLLSALYKNAGSTLTMLQVQYHSSSNNNLCQILESLESDGFLISRGKDNPYYMLSNDGDLLYHQLSLKYKPGTWDPYVEE